MPRPGDSYTTHNSGFWTRRKGGPYYNISVTVDKQCLAILESLPKGSKSEVIRWALKDWHLRQDPSPSQVIAELEEAIQRHLLIQDKMRQEIVDLQEARTKNVTIMGKMMALIEKLLLRTRA